MLFVALEFHVPGNAKESSPVGRHPSKGNIHIANFGA